MVLFSFCRIGFYFFNAGFFPEMTFSTFLYLMWGGLTFDFAAVMYVNMIVILMTILPFKFRFHHTYQNAVRYTFFIFNGAALLMNVSDFIYYQFTLRRTTADVIKQFQNEQNIGGLILQFMMDYWYIVLIWVLMMTLMVRLYDRIKVWGPQSKSNVRYYSGSVFMMLVMALVVIVGIRGGVRQSTRPMTLSNAGEYVKDPKHVSIVLNTPFAFIRTIGKTKVAKVNYYSELELDSIYSPIHVPKDNAEFTPQNVVVIILESFSKEFVGSFNREKENGTYQGYTPFLDSLLQFSLTYEYSFSNGRKSIDGLPSVMSSIPSLGVPYFLSPYSGNRINSLASLLETKGYHTSFFHGAPNGSMGFQAFMNIAGVDHYYGMTEYNNDDDFDGLWGIWDEKFLQYYADQLNTFKEPFVSSLFTVSSHHPFEIPKEYEQKFPEGVLPIHKCVRYTDYSLRKFFEKASKMPWYNNTLFVFAADHTSKNIQYPEHRTNWGLYSIPILFFKPDHSLVGRKQEIFQQIDIMPSVLGYLHFDQPYVAYGRDAFREDVEPFAFNYKDNVYQYFLGDHLLVFDGEKSIALYDFKRDKMLQENLMERLPDVVNRMERNLKALIQQYNNRLVEDRMVIQ